MLTINAISVNRLSYVSDFRSLSICLMAILLILVCLVIVRRALYLRYLAARELTYLELTPGISTSKSALATEQLFTVIHGLDSKRSRWDALLGRRTVLSLEAISSREQGIRFVAVVNRAERLVFEQSIQSYLPGLRVREIDERFFPGPTHEDTLRLLRFKQTKHFAYPLRVQETLEQHDPVAYITEAMNKLESGELMIFQLVLSPASSRINKQMSRRLSSGQNMTVVLWRGSVPACLLRVIARLCFMPIRLSLIMLSGWLFGHQEAGQPSSPQVKRLSQAELIVGDSVHEKLSQPLFHADIRALIVSKTQQKAAERSRALRTAMTTFRVPKYQALSDRPWVDNLLPLRVRFVLLQKRLPSLAQGRIPLLSTSEIAAIYHFPNTTSAQTENIVTSLSRNLPAPVSLKANPKLDIILGNNHYHGRWTPIGLTEAERERHIYIVGGTGNGKTTMLLGGIVQDMQNGKGIAVIDPHGDLAEEVLRHIPESRLDDVVYFNPDDLDYPLGLNLLELPPGLSGTDLLRERDLITESVISIFRKLFSGDDSGGHRVEYILRNAVQTALTLPDATLFTVYDLLNDPTYQKTVVKGLTDRNLRNFWWHELGRAGDYQRVKMAAGVTAKIGRFLFSASAKQILEQPRSTLDFDDIIASGKILICNVSKGRLGEDTASLFGTTVLARLQIATLRRARLKTAHRRPFYVYVDEFQNFATTSFVQMLSEARKYKLFLTMAEQSTSQQEQQRMVQIILANVGTLVCFRTGNPADEQLLLPSFAPFVNPGELSYLPAYKFYVRLSALIPHEPLSGETQLLTRSGTEEMFERAIALTREQYVVPRPQPAATGDALTINAPLLSKPVTVYPVRMAD